MREIEVSRLTEVIEKLCIEANEHLPEDVKDAIKTCRACEDGEIAKGVLDNIIENFDIADLSLIHIYRVDREKAYIVGVGCKGKLDIEKIRKMGIKGIRGISGAEITGDAETLTVDTV